MSYLETAKASLAALRDQPPESAPPAQLGIGPKAIGDELGAMSLDLFAQAGLIVRVRSEVLGCQILFVSDNVPEAALTDADLPVYRAAELRKLALLHPEPHHLRGLHDAKTIFDGTITDVQDRND